jgi:hypothetical protein
MWVPSLLEGMNAQEMAQLGLKMPINILSINHMTGGNSGSPIVEENFTF